MNLKETTVSNKFTRRRTLQMMGLAGAAGLFAPNLLVSKALAAKPKVPTGQVIVGFSQEPTVFNPLMPRIEVDDGVQLSLFDALFRVNVEGEFIPALAAEVPTVENGGLSEDGLKWRIKLRDDVKWHDGKPFTAEDVKFTLELVVDPNFRSWRTIGHDLVSDLTVISPTEITWRMAKPFAPYMALLVETMMVPKHVLGPEKDRNNAPFNRAPIGTGPFKWVSRTAGDHLELAANPDYFGEGPYIKRLIYKYIPDLTVLYTQFKSGDIDIVGAQYISPDNYKEAEALPGKVVGVVPAPNVECLVLNMKRPQFKDKAVREALYAALDKQSIIDVLYHSLPTATESYLPQQSYFYNPDLPKHEFNIEKAKQILDEAGWVPGAGGIRAKDGTRLSFSNSTTSGNHLREQTQQFMQQTFAEIGVEMTIANKPPAVMWGDYWMKSEFDTAIAGTVFITGADADVTARFHSKAIPAQNGSGSNTGQYQNEVVDKLLEQGASTFIPEERKQIYHQLQETIRDDLPLLPIFQNATVQGHKEGIKGIVPNINTRINTWHAAAYYWDS
jgi:peptide/nickel transport system substrate-binding protein